MIKENYSRQLSFQDFKTPFYYGLDKNNRWVRLTQKLPWDEMAKIYTQNLNKTFGRPAKPTRVVIGAIIINHKQRLTDEETILAIQENPYLQYFIGYEEFCHKPPFDPSLFVTIGKRLGQDALDKMSEKFVSMVFDVENRVNSDREKTKPPQSDSSSSSSEDRTSREQNVEIESDTSFHKGALLVDASVAPADIKYPTDFDLLNSCREHSERLIDNLYEPEPGKVKPRTYRRKARKDYLSLARRRRKNAKELRKGLGKQLNYVKRNINTIDKLLDNYAGRNFPLKYRDLKTFWIIRKVYRQQQEMYDNKSHKTSNRIVSISQPHIRPIVREKAKATVEFGAKISACVIEGYTFLDRISWDAYNESKDVPTQVKLYKERFGCYPKVVIGDTIYGTRKNRAWLKELGIQYSGKPLGRPPKQMLKNSAALKAERKQRRLEFGLRNHIEGKFGEGKRGYDLGLVKTKTPRTSEAWIAAVFFVMNLARWLREDFFVPLFKLIFEWLFPNNYNFKERLRPITA